MVGTGLATVLAVSAAQADIPAVATVVATVPTKGMCAVGDIAAVGSNFPPIGTEFTAPNFILTQTSGVAVPTNTAITLQLTLASAPNRCQMLVPSLITVTVDGQPVTPIQSVISAGGKTMQVTFLAPARIWPTATMTLTPTATLTPIPTQTAAVSPTPSTSTSTPSLAATGRPVGYLAGIGLAAVGLGLLLVVIVRARRDMTED
jgi:hypothetical protein